MTLLYASNNSEYFAVRQPSKIYLYRDGDLALSHKVVDKLAGELILVADSGDLFFQSSEGMLRLRKEKGVKAERCRAIAGLDGSSEGGTLGGISLRADGEQVAYEQILPVRKFSSKLKRLLGQKSSQADVGPSLHRFIVSNWSGRSSSSYFETVVDPRVSAGLVWWMSTDFGFLAIIERGRDGLSLLRIIDVLHESIVNELTVDGRLSRDRAITTNGTVGFGLEKQNKRALVIWTYSQDRFQVAYPKESRMLHLAKDKVVFYSRTYHRLIAKSFDNKVLAEVNLAPLAKLGVEYLVSFNPRETVELATFQNGKLRVHHTDLDQLPTDAKRWELLGEQQRAEQLESQMQQLLADRYEEQDREFVDEHRQQLAADIESYRPAVSTMADDMAAANLIPKPIEIARPLAGAFGSVSLDLSTAPDGGEESGKMRSKAMPREPRFSSKLEADDALEQLRMSYIAGEVAREDYHNERTSIEAELELLEDLPAADGANKAEGEPPLRTLNILGE